MEGLKWWGYLHTEGTIQVKRYFGPLDIKEAKESSFVARICYPFVAYSREEAVERVKKALL